MTSSAPKKLTIINFENLNSYTSINSKSNFRYPSPKSKFSSTPKSNFYM